MDTPRFYDYLYILMQFLFIELIIYIYFSFNLSKLTLLLSHDTNDVNVS